MKKCLLALITVALLLSACGQEATSTPTEIADTPTPDPTATDVPPTETPTLAPSPTSIPPTVTPTSVPPTPLPSPTLRVEPTRLSSSQAQDKAAAPPTPDIPFEEVHFGTEGGVNLAATLFGEGEVVVIFLHQGRGNTSQISWQPFARQAAAIGFAALTVDYRGRGKSEGQANESHLIEDARAAAIFLRERGFERLVCMGAGTWGAVPCIRLALEFGLEGLVIISSTVSASSTSQDITAQDLSQLTFPKLFVYGEKDQKDVPEAMSELYRLSPEPKELVSYDNAARGTNLLRSPYGDDLRQRLLDFLEGLPLSTESPTAAP